MLGACIAFASLDPARATETEAMINLGDKVQYIGTKEQDVYHGQLVGKVGTVTQLTPFIGIRVLMESDYGWHWVIFDAGPSDGSLVKKVADEK